MSLTQIKTELRQIADPNRAINLARFFKTGKGDYSEGDSFLGLTMPQIRQTAKKYKGLEITEIASLVNSPHHEEE